MNDAVLVFFKPLTPSWPHIRLKTDLDYIFVRKLLGLQHWCSSISMSLMEPHYWYDSIYLKKKKKKKTINLFFLEDFFISKLKRNIRICAFYRLPGSNEIGTNFKVVGSELCKLQPIIKLVVAKAYNLFAKTLGHNPNL